MGTDPVVLYYRPGCVACAEVRALLDVLGVAYEAVDCTAQSAQAALMAELAAHDRDVADPALPVVTVGVDKLWMSGDKVERFRCLDCNAEFYIQPPLDDVACPKCGSVGICQAR